MESGGGLVRRESGIETAGAFGRRDHAEPPEDDVCPICLGDYTIPCRANCGHWFCASCILQLWSFGTAVQKCKCPLCFSRICKLSLKASSFCDQPEEEVVKAIKEVKRYNRLYAGDWQSLLMMNLMSLLFVPKRVIQGLINPNRARFNFYLLRYIALALAFLYQSFKFDFIPTGGVRIVQLFDICAISLSFVLVIVGIAWEMMRRRRGRRLAAIEARNQ